LGFVDGIGRDTEWGVAGEKIPSRSARVASTKTGAFPAVALEVPASDETDVGIALGTQALHLTSDGALRAFPKSKLLAVPNI
jgi:hypothetical protein